MKLNSIKTLNEKIREIADAKNWNSRAPWEEPPKQKQKLLQLQRRRASPETVSPAATTRSSSTATSSRSKASSPWTKPTHARKSCSQSLVSCTNETTETFNHREVLFFVTSKVTTKLETGTVTRLCRQPQNILVLGGAVHRLHLKSRCRSRPQKVALSVSCAKRNYRNETVEPHQKFHQELAPTKVAASLAPQNLQVQAWTR